MRTTNACELQLITPYKYNLCINNRRETYMNILLVLDLFLKHYKFISNALSLCLIM